MASEPMARSRPDEREANAILDDAAAAYTRAFGDRLIASYALGSLAHGGFSPLVSDIDLGLILSDPAHDRDADRVGAIADQMRTGGSALHERLSVFWGTPSTLTGASEGGRFPPLDRLDLIQNGRLLAGSDVRAGLPAPGARELLIVGAEFALEFLAGIGGGSATASRGLGSIRPATSDTSAEIRHPELLLSRGVRRVTKIVLFPVRFLFTAETGQVGTNDHAVAHYLTRADTPSKPLVQAALAWRREAPADAPATRAVLGDQLVPLYLYFIDDHVGRLTSAGRQDLADAFTTWRTQLGPP
jgi:hypothetical protein